MGRSLELSLDFNGVLSVSYCQGFFPYRECTESIPKSQVVLQSMLLVAAECLLWGMLSEDISDFWNAIDTLSAIMDSTTPQYLTFYGFITKM